MPCSKAKRIAKAKAASEAARRARAERAKTTNLNTRLSRSGRVIMKNNLLVTVDDDNDEVNKEEENDVVEMELAGDNGAENVEEAEIGDDDDENENNDNKVDHSEDSTSLDSSDQSTLSSSSSQPTSSSFSGISPMNFYEDRQPKNALMSTKNSTFISDKLGSKKKAPSTLPETSSKLPRSSARSKSPVAPASKSVGVPKNTLKSSGYIKKLATKTSSKKSIITSTTTTTSNPPPSGRIFTRSKSLGNVNLTTYSSTGVTTIQVKKELVDAEIELLGDHQVSDNEIKPATRRQTSTSTSKQTTKSETKNKTKTKPPADIDDLVAATLSMQIKGAGKTSKSTSGPKKDPKTVKQPKTVQSSPLSPNTSTSGTGRARGRPTLIEQEARRKAAAALAALENSKTEPEVEPTNTRSQRAVTKQNQPTSGSLTQTPKLRETRSASTSSTTTSNLPKPPPTTEKRGVGRPSKASLSPQQPPSATKTRTIVARKAAAVANAKLPYCRPSTSRGPFPVKDEDENSDDDEDEDESDEDDKSYYTTKSKKAPSQAKLDAIAQTILEGRQLRRRPAISLNATLKQETGLKSKKEARIQAQKEKAEKKDKIKEKNAEKEAKKKKEKVKVEQQQQTQSPKKEQQPIRRRLNRTAEEAKNDKVNIAKEIYMKVQREAQSQNKDEINFKTRLVSFHKTPYHNNCYAVRFCQWTGENDQMDIFAVAGGAKVSVYRILDQDSELPKSSNSKKQPKKLGFETLFTFTDPDGEDFYTVNFSYNRRTLLPIPENYILAGGKKGILRLFSCVLPNSGGDALVGHGEAINDIAVDPKTPELIFTASSDWTVRMWNLITRRTIAVFGGWMGHCDQVLSVDIHPRYSMIVSSGVDKQIMIWRYDTPDLLKALVRSTQLPRPSDPPTTHWPPVVQVPNYETHHPHSHYVDCVRFFGDFLITRSCDRNLKMWAVANEDGEQLDLLEATRKFIIRQPNRNENFKYRPNISLVHAFDCDTTDMFFLKFGVSSGKMLAIGDDDGDVWLWDLSGPGPMSIKGEVLEAPYTKQHGRVRRPVRECALNRTCTHMVAVMDGGYIMLYAINRTAPPTPSPNLIALLEQTKETTSKTAENGVDLQNQPSTSSSSTTPLEKEVSTSATTNGFSKVENGVLNGGDVLNKETDNVSQEEGTQESEELIEEYPEGDQEVILLSSPKTVSQSSLLQILEGPMDES